MNTINRRKTKNVGASNKSKFQHNKRNTRVGNKKRVSSLNPEMLVKKSVVNEQEKVYVPSRSFDEMPINVNLKANLFAKKFTHPTKIQDETLEHLVDGKDLVGIANTGTGKTGAFLIPVIEQLLNNNKSFRTLVVVPTRELALQVEEEFKALAKGLGIYSASFIGGTSVNRDLAKLKRRSHIIIGTPGRLIDLSNQGALKLGDISTLILDEFDRMLDMGFVHDIKKMIASMHRRKQTMLFSATIDKTQEALIKTIVHNPIEVKVSSGKTTSDHVEQDIIRVPTGADKFKLLLNLMSTDDFEKVLIFAETKHLANRVSQKLNKSGISSDQIHGNKSQNYRNNALLKFKKGKIKVLVATDVAARGIDVSDVTHVINYQLPMSFDSYVHRIGRTGRAGKQGKAFTFVD